MPSQQPEIIVRTEERIEETVSKNRRRSNVMAQEAQKMEQEIVQKIVLTGFARPKGT
jgi:hypothetical protein